jgi:hypothetical protein
MLPVWLMPVRSPFTSAMNTGTPMRKTLGQGLQRDGLAGAGGAGDEAVAVGQVGQQVALVWAFLAISMGRPWCGRTWPGFTGNPGAGWVKK